MEGDKRTTCNGPRTDDGFTAARLDPARKPVNLTRMLRTTLAFRGTIAAVFLLLGSWWLFDAAAGAEPVTPPAAGPDIYSFKLSPTVRAPGAVGAGELKLAWSPFGIAVSADGHVVYDMEITIEGLLDPTRAGPSYAYVAWIASPNLDRTERLGVVGEAGRVNVRIASWNKFLVLVTLERDANAERRSGPVMLRGRSPSGFMASFQSHELFNLIPH